MWHAETRVWTCLMEPSELDTSFVQQAQIVLHYNGSISLIEEPTHSTHGSHEAPKGSPGALSPTTPILHLPLWPSHEAAFGRKWTSSRFRMGRCASFLTRGSRHQEGRRCLQWQWLGRFLGIIGWDPSVCKSNRLHVDILRFSYINLRYIPQIPLKCSVILLKSWTSTGYFSNSTGSSVTNCLQSLVFSLWHPILKLLLLTDGANGCPCYTRCFTGQVKVVPGNGHLLPSKNFDLFGCVRFMSLRWVPFSDILSPTSPRTWNTWLVQVG